MNWWGLPVGGPGKAPQAAGGLAAGRLRQGRERVGQRVADRLSTLYHTDYHRYRWGCEAAAQGRRVDYFPYRFTQRDHLVTAHRPEWGALARRAGVLWQRGGEGDINPAYPAWGWAPQYRRSDYHIASQVRPTALLAEWTKPPQGWRPTPRVGWWRRAGRLLQATFWSSRWDLVRWARVRRGCGD